MNQAIQQAIQAIKAGDKAAGRRILSEILKTDRENETAWLWLSAAVENPEQRRRCLKEVLRINPNHPQATAALSRLQKPPAPPTPPPVIAEEDIVPSWLQALGSPSSPETTPVQPPPYDTLPTFAQPQQSLAVTEQPSFIADAATAQPPPANKPRRGLAWYDVWLSVLPSPTEKSFRFILGDPKLSLDRGLIWMFCATLIQLLAVLALLLVYWLPAFETAAFQSGLDINVTAQVRNVSLVLFVVGVPIITSAYTLFFALQVGLQHLLARLLGGQGTYEHLLFATAAYQAPLLLISIVAVFIPYINFCVGPLLGIYSIVLMTNSLRAVYNFGIERALAVIFLPGILLIFLCCLIGLLLQGPIEQMLMEAMMTAP